MAHIDYSKELTKQSPEINCSESDLDTPEI